MKANTLKQIVLSIVKAAKERETEDGVNKKTLINYSGSYIRKEYWRIADFQKLISQLTSSDLHRVASKAIITGRIVQLIDRLKEHEEPSRIALEECNSFLESFQSTKYHTVYLPIKGLHFEDDISSITFSDDIKVINLNETDAKAITPYYEQEKNTIDQLIPVALSVKVLAHDSVRAIEHAIEIGKLLIHFFRFVDYFAWDDEDLGLRIPGYGIVAEDLRPIAITDEGTFSWQHKESFEESFEVDTLRYRDFESYGLSRIGDIFSKKLRDELNEMEQSLLRSLVWFGESKKESDLAARFLKLMLAIECLIHSNTVDPITATLRERVAYILKDNLNDRLAIVGTINDLYSLRSKIVHHASSEVPFEKLSDLEYITVSLIEKFLTFEKWISIQNKDQLQQMIDRMKYS